MELTKEENNVVISSNTQFESRPMQIMSARGMSQALKLLRADIYTNKKLAVVREYLCNGIDEHKKYAPSTPVEVTVTEDSFIVRDFGKGLDKESVFNIFGAYMESTKTKDEIGGFGLGSKSGHAYADIFHIHSYFGGNKSSYSFILGNEDGLESASSNLTGVQASNEPTGIEVIVPIKIQDQDSFIKLTKEFAGLCQFPINLNGELVKEKEPLAKVGELSVFKAGQYNYREFFVRMGGVTYECDDQYIPSSVSDKRGFIYIMDVSINSVDIPPSRENISYTEKTKATLKNLREETNKLILKDIEDSIISVESHDIYNIFANDSLSKISDTVWVRNRLLIDATKKKYLALEQTFKDFNFGNNVNRVYMANDKGKLKDVGGAIKEDHRFVVLKTFVAFGERKMEFFEDKHKDFALRYIKNDTFDFAKLPAEISHFFIDERETKVPVIRQPRGAKNSVVVNYKEILFAKGYSSGTSVGKTIADWQKYITDRKIEFYIDKNDSRLNKLDVYSDFKAIVPNSERALKFFKTILPSFDDWLKQNETKIKEVWVDVVAGQILCDMGYKIRDGVKKVVGVGGRTRDELFTCAELKLIDLSKEKLPKKLENVKNWLDSECPLAYIAKEIGHPPDFIIKQIEEKVSKLA